jgi:hypothetical protein
MKLYPVSGFTGKAVKEAAASFLTDECTVITDGLPCFAAVKIWGCEHMPLRASGNKVLHDSIFKWVNMIPGNVKCALDGRESVLPFEACMPREVRVSPQCPITFDRNRYSAPCAYADKSVQRRAHAGQIRFYADGRRIAGHPRVFGHIICSRQDGF